MRPFKSPFWILCCHVLALAALHATAPHAQALERLCDPSFENCRPEVINRIRAEVVGIDVATWFFEDRAFTNELIAKWNAGVPVRVIGDPDANAQHPLNATLLSELAAAGIPIRHKVSSGIEHWKMMLFSGQNVVYFGSANFSSDAFFPVDPYRNFVDETIYLTDDDSVVDTMKMRFDDAWVNTTGWANYANAPNSSVFRKYPVVTPDPELNFAPASGSSSYRTRSVNAYNAENQKIDVIMYRITDQAHVDALINAKNRGVPIRFYTEQLMYRDVSQPWHSMSVDKLYMAGIPIRDRAHAGLNHEKLVLLYDQRMTIFGSSNMTSKSSDSQHEHNYFTKKTGIFDWFEDQFNRKWSNTNPVGAPETKPFVPLPPDTPVNRTPADGAVGIATTGAEITWYGGPWAHLYDVYLDTANPPQTRIATNVALGPSLNTSQNQSFTLPTLTPGTTYYWMVVSKTMALLSTAGPVHRFTTAGSVTEPPPGDTIVLWTANVPGSQIRGDWTVGADTGAGHGSIWNPDRGRAKVSPALASPPDYFEMTFDAEGGRAYHLWLRMRAQQNSTSNDSVHVQFSGATTSSGAPYAPIGTTASAEVVLQAAGGQTPLSWGWTDNGWGSLGPHIYFPAAGTYTIRVQRREDGAIIDQIVLSPDVYLTAPPGDRRNDTTILAATGTPPDPTPVDTVVMWASNVASSGIYGDWAVGADSGAGSKSIWNPDRGRAKVAPALSAPVNYFETTFDAQAGRAYHLWLRMRAQRNSLSNDSVHVQFSGAVTAGGQPYARIGSTESAEVVLQDGPGGAAPSSWGWTDNGWGSPGPHIYFPSTGTYTIRVQQREDGAIIDQIVLSPDAYLTTAPGARRDDTTILSP